MKKLFLLIAATCLAAIASAQNPTAYFMDGSTFRSQFNPAFAPQRGYLNLPALGGIQLTVGGNVALNSFVYPHDGKLVTLLDESVSAAQALANLKPDNYLGDDTRVNIFGIGKYTANRKNFWSFDIGVRATQNTSLPYSLFEFLKLGKEGNIGNISVSTENYLEAGFNYSFPLLDDRLYVGARVKFLAGLARAEVRYSRFDVTMQEDIWSVDAEGSLDVTMGGASVDMPEGSETFEFNDINMKPTKPAGYGFAVDLGATYDILPDLQASLAIVDLGFVNWSQSNTIAGVSTQHLEFTGTTISGSGSESVPDFEFEMLKFRPTESKSANKMLRTTLNAGIEYRLWQRKIGFGLLYSARFWAYRTYHNITGSVNFQPIHWFTLSGSYSVLDNRSGAVGLAMNLSPGWINLFVGTDMLLSRHTPQWIPIKQNTMNLTFGLGIPIGKRGERGTWGQETCM